MSVVVERTAVSINLEGGCDGPMCAGLSKPLFEQLGGGAYGVCSVLPVPETLEDWRSSHRTSRKRADRAERLGYRFARIQRHEHADAIHAINTSLAERQGRPMSAGYQIRPSASPDPVYTCPRHAVRPYGVLNGRTLVAYLWLYRSGELGLISSILGHGEHLANGIMFLLVARTIEAEIPYHGFLTYNRADSGTQGLHWFKERCGFMATEVSWRA